MQMKKLMRVTCLVLALLMAFLLCACDGGTGDDGTTGSESGSTGTETTGSTPSGSETSGTGTESAPTGTAETTGTTGANPPTTAPEDDDDEPEPIVIENDKLANMRIVYPSTMFSGGNRNKGTVWTEIENLQTAIKRYYQVELSMNSDSPRYGEAEYEILIGDTTREESAMALDDLSLKDYGYVIVGKKIIIKGGSYTYLKNAIALFNSMVVSSRAAGTGKFYHSGLDRVVNARYTASAVLMNDTPLTSFNIVYPADAEDSEDESDDNRVIAR